VGGEYHREELPLAKTEVIATSLESAAALKLKTEISLHWQQKTGMVIAVEKDKERPLVARALENSKKGADVLNVWSFGEVQKAEFLTGEAMVWSVPAEGVP